MFATPDAPPELHTSPPPDPDSLSYQREQAQRHARLMSRPYVVVRLPNGRYQSCSQVIYDAARFLNPELHIVAAFDASGDVTLAPT